MDLNILLTPLYGNGAKIESFDERSLLLGAINYRRVVPDIDWQCKVDETKPVTGEHRRELILRRTDAVPLHLGHALHLLTDQENISMGWYNWRYITFDGCTIRRGDGVLVVPCLRMSAGDWRFDHDVLAERAVPAASALVRIAR
jgi:hypothetical protein